jgi:hypothetical protein
MNKPDVERLKRLLQQGCTFRVYDRHTGDPVEELVPDPDILALDEPAQEATRLIFRPIGLLRMAGGGVEWARARPFTAEWLLDAHERTPQAPPGGMRLAGRRYDLVIAPGTPDDVDWAAWTAEKGRVITGDLAEAWQGGLEALR